MAENPKRIFLGVTGATGMPYALALIQGLNQAGVDIHLAVSEAGRRVLELETDCTPEHLAERASVVYHCHDLAAGPASGSFRLDAMVICPCSMATLAAIACGAGRNLIHRAADVTLKERRPLVLVPRETPLNRVHLKNMLDASEAGAMIMPACPGFYHRPRSIEELAAQFAGRIMDQLGLPQNLAPGWTGP